MSDSNVSEALLAFWFGDADDDVTVARRQARLWWAKDEATDRLVEERFGAALHRVAGGDFSDWPQTPRGRLASVILLDQVPRNIRRGSPAAFAYDALARQQATAALAAGDEPALRPIERVFLYMPFEHAEDLELQEFAVERFTVLCAVAPPTALPVFQGFVDFAVRHRDIIRRFGRFPHRNVVLGRPSTAEEKAFLAEPGSSF